MDKNIVDLWLRDWEHVEILEVATKIGCPGNCIKFCPQEIMLKTWGTKERLMTLEIFKAILFSVPKNVFLYFAGLTEPFSNPYFVDMCSYATSLGYRFGVASTLIGASSKDIKRIAELKPVLFHVHMADFINLTVAPSYKAEKACRKYIRNAQFNLMNGYFETNNRETVARKQTPSQNGLSKCFKRVHPQMMVFPDGSTTICCIDIRMEYILGNLLNQSYNELRKKFLSKKSYVLCTSCDYNIPLLRFYLRKSLHFIYKKLSDAAPLRKVRGD